MLTGAEEMVIDTGALHGSPLQDGDEAGGVKPAAGTGAGDAATGAALTSINGAVVGTVGAVVTAAGTGAGNASTGAVLTSLKGTRVGAAVGA